MHVRVSTFAPTRWTSSRSCDRFGRGSARSAASTTRKRKSASWQRSSWRSSSIREGSVPICSSSSGEAVPRNPRCQTYAFEDSTLYDSHRLPWLGWHPPDAESDPEAVLQPEPVDSRVAHPVRAERATRAARGARNTRCCTTSYSELTRLGIEVKNLKMRVESMSSRLDFDERRARALEGVVQYRPGAVPPLAAARRRRATAAAGPRRNRPNVANAPTAQARTAAARRSRPGPAGVTEAARRPAKASARRAAEQRLANRAIQRAGTARPSTNRTRRRE